MHDTLARNALFLALTLRRWWRRAVAVRPFRPTAHLVIRHDDSDFSEPDARRIARRCLRDGRLRRVLVDLSQAAVTTTAALARLVLLRRLLLRRGADLCLAGLAGQPLALYEVHRFDCLLPRDCLPAATAA